MALSPITSSNITSLPSLQAQLYVNEGYPVSNIETSPAYIFGRIVVRPAIDAGISALSWSYELARCTLSALDRRVSALWPAFPGASAEEVKEHKDNKVVRLDGNQKALVLSKEEIAQSLVHVQIFQAIAINPANYGPFVSRLTVKEKIDLAKNQEVNKNFHEFHSVILDLTQFVLKKSNKLGDFATNLKDTCKNLEITKRRLGNILDDIRQSQLTSHYAPSASQKRRFVLVPFKHDDKYKVLRDPQLWEILPHLISDATKNQLSMISGFSANDIDASCNTDPLLQAVLVSVEQLGALMRVFNPEQGWTYQDFKDLFSDESINNFKENIESIKANIESFLKTVDDVATKIASEKFAKLESEVNGALNDIYNEQNGLIKQISGTSMAARVLSQHAGHVTSWEFYSTGITGETLHYRFRVGDLATNDKHEL